MKMRYVVIGYTVVIAILACWLGFGWNETFYEKQAGAAVDMTKLNADVQQINRRIQAGDKLEEVEEAFACEILLKKDENYADRLNQSIQKGNTILDYYEGEVLAGKLIWEGSAKYYAQAQKDIRNRLILTLSFFSVAGYLLLLILYIYVMKPFQRLQRFSTQVAQGNLDMPLSITKKDYFGAFTESFDILREELKKARENEYRANVSKKELVAELSHDIKTPVATIKATCEVLQVKESNSDTLEKINVIAGKADMIDALINNLFHATMEELQALKMEVTEESSLQIPAVFQELKYYGEIVVENEIAECLVYMDRLRFRQVVDNLINNAYKYAEASGVQIHFSQEAQGIKICIRDQGAGVPEEELSHVMEKFYRGSNAEGKSGSGLGLYLAKSFMENMRGGMECYNDHGFVINLYLQKVLS